MQGTPYETLRQSCVELQLRPNNVGYVMVRNPHRGGRTDGAHRVAWEGAHGPIPAGLHVLHRCDNPRCINVEHLWLGDAADNARDRERKGRGRRPDPSHARPPKPPRPCQLCGTLVTRLSKGMCKRCYDRAVWRPQRTRREAQGR
jgi:hypothetical protein